VTSALHDINASDGEPVAAKDMARALTAAELVFSDGATQTFDPGGSTTYVESGKPTRGEWAVVEDGRFSSFWPPSYRAIYDLRWHVEGGLVVGLVFTDPHGTRFAGRYR
jgi:hypothetical protein